ncbi:MAG TPA: acetyl-CoA carboxylase biotin carboxyl carrier protein subunit [Acetobacteraceae bacterium]|nr:acetyl-CoA carboxylase biotin carboxyl carrier protein subunit [Acetobacteraceae bacterium]
MSSIQFDPEAVRSLANILRDAGLTEIEIVDADRRIRVVRAPPTVAAPSAALATVPVATVPAAPVEPEPAADETPPAGAVTSPMVGVAFLSPDPDSPPYVSPGQAVTAGQTVMLIEAMKTFNQIKAPRAGTVTRVLVTNGQPVEYGQPLLVIA